MAGNMNDGLSLKIKMPQTLVYTSGMHMTLDNILNKLLNWIFPVKNDGCQFEMDIQIDN